MNVGFGNGFSETFSGADLKIIECHCTSLRETTPSKKRTAEPQNNE
jgi:hypothetical protein